MDIYKYAESINYNADYMDMSTGYIYCIQEYGKALKFGFPTHGIKVIDFEGHIIGYAKKENDE